MVSLVFSKCQKKDGKETKKDATLNSYISIFFFFLFIFYFFIFFFYIKSLSSKFILNELVNEICRAHYFSNG